MTGTSRRRVGIAAGFVPVVAALVAFTLTGCGAGAAGVASAPETSTPEPTATLIPGEAVSGTESTGFDGVDFPIPTSAQSVTIAFECSSGFYMVEFGDTMALGLAALRGACDGPQELGWPVLAGSEPSLEVSVGEGVEWTATPTFSTAPFVRDDALTDDCDEFAPSYSALMNADQGFTLYDAFGADEWTTRVDGAAADIAVLAKNAHPVIADAVARVAAIASDPNRTIGAALTPDASAAIEEITQACNANQTPLILDGEFGG